MRIVVCEAQVPFVEGGRRVPRPRAGPPAPPARPPDRAGQRPVQVVSEGRDPGPRRRVAAPRPQREQRHPHRPGHRHQVPVLFRPPPAQGGVADPPVPRRLRAGRHASTATSTTSKATSALRDRLIALDRRDARRVPAASSPTPATPPAGSPATMACTPKRCIIRRRLAERIRAGPLGDYILSVGRIESVKRVDLAVRGAGPRRPPDCGWSSPATARSAPTPSGSSRRSGVADRVDVPRRGRRRDAARPLCRRARRRLRALRRGLRIRDARSVPGPQARDHRDRRRRAAGVRRRRRQRRRRATRARGGRRGVRAPARRSRLRGRRSATPATPAPPTVTWHGVIDRLVGA